jgi:hypothetical protein
MTLPALLTVREFAACLGVTQRRACALAASGRLAGALKIGRDWVIAAAAHVAPGSRGPRRRDAESATRTVLSECGKAQALKHARRRRFRGRPMQAPRQAPSAVVFRLPRDAICFEERELEADDLHCVLVSVGVWR